MRDFSTHKRSIIFLTVRVFYRDSAEFRYRSAVYLLCLLFYVCLSVCKKKTIEPFFHCVHVYIIIVLRTF